jgi:hypothetical protein
VVSIMLWPRKFFILDECVFGVHGDRESPSMTDRMTIARIQSLTLLPKTYILSWFRQQICHRGRGMAVCGRG